MPCSSTPYQELIKSLADELGVSVATVKKYWDKAKDIAEKEYPKKKGDDLYAIVVGILRRMLKNKKENNIINVIDPVYKKII